MIATLVAPILWLGALERFLRWQTNRNLPAGGALLTAISLAVMVTLDTPFVTETLIEVGLRESEVITLERVLLLVACIGALVFALALDGRLSARRIAVRVIPLVAVGFLVLVNGAAPRLTVSGEGPHDHGNLRSAVETTAVYSCLAVTTVVVALAAWRASQRTRVHRTQLRILAAGGVVFAIVAVVNVIAGGILLQHLQVGVWGLRLNRLMLDAAFASWALVLMASWLTSALIATRDWLRFRAAYEQVNDVFPDLAAGVRAGGGWIELTDARAVVVLDGWAMLARPGDALHAGLPPGERALAVARWLDLAAAYGSITAADLTPPPGWRAARWVAAVTSRTELSPLPLVEKVR